MVIFILILSIKIKMLMFFIDILFSTKPTSVTELPCKGKELLCVLFSSIIFVRDDIL